MIVSILCAGESEGDKLVKLNVALEESRKDLVGLRCPDAGAFREVRVILPSIPADVWKNGSLPFLDNVPEPLPLPFIPLT